MDVVRLSIFFRPMPPRLSPGRYTSFYLPEIELIYACKATKESWCGPLHSP